MCLRPRRIIFIVLVAGKGGKAVRRRRLKGAVTKSPFDDDFESGANDDDAKGCWCRPFKGIGNMHL